MTMPYTIVFFIYKLKCNKISNIKCTKTYSDVVEHVS